MNDVPRSPWGNEQSRSHDPSPDGLRPLSVGRLLTGLFLGIVVPFVVVRFLVGQGVFDGLIEPLKLKLVRGLFPYATTLLLDTVLIFLLPISPRKLWVRILRVVGLMLSAGVVTAAAGLLFTVVVWPDSTQTELAVLPSIVLLLFAALTPLALILPVWPTNVPDNEVWMVLQASGHLLRYVPAGIHFLPPSHSCVPYTEKGLLAIHIDDESFISHDYFPYRVIMDVACTFNPLDANPDSWLALRKMTRRSLEADLTKEFSYIVRHVIAQYSRENSKPSAALRTIVMDITEAVQARSHLGIRLLPVNGINLVIDAPGLVIDARRRRLTVEALALPSGQPRELEFGQLLKMISAETNLRIDVNEQGALTFALAPGDETSLPQVLDRLNANYLRTRFDEGAMASNREIPAEAQSKPEAHAGLPESKKTPPRNPMELGLDSTVVDTDQDSEGVFVPRDPDAPR